MKDNEKTYYNGMECKYNSGVNCSPIGRNCEACGWNPDVAIARLVKICKKRRINLPDYLSDTKKRL